jgi:formylglycine-generating enzyme required for sulfatase activity
MHDAIVERLIAGAADKLRETQGVARQVPDEIGRVMRVDVEAALALTQASLKADVPELRGDVGAAHAAVRRCRFPRDEHQALFGAMAELAYALEDIEQAAATADYPEPEITISLPRQHLVPRSALEHELDALEARLQEFDRRLADIEKQQSGAHEFEDQDELIADVTVHAGAQSLVAHELAGQRQVDIRGLFHVIEGLGRIVRSFVSTVAPSVARVTRALKTAAAALGRSSREVVSAGGTVVRVALQARPGGFATGDRFRDFEGAPEMVVVPVGSFMMGAPDSDVDSSPVERPQHEVTIAKPFAVGIAPVTRGEFAQFVAATKHQVEVGAYVLKRERWTHDTTRSWRDPGFAQTDDHPVVCVSWHDAEAYVAWLRERSGKVYRLLSEAEWEYCCRARTTTPYSTGGAITAEQANFGQASNGTTSVAKFPPNPWGLRDMHGNVWEWCEDSWHRDYSGSPPSDGSVWQGGDQSLRVQRGGSWLVRSQFLRSTVRDADQSDVRVSNVGFRVARTL